MQSIHTHTSISKQIYKQSASPPTPTHHTYTHIPCKVRQPRRHVLEAQMLHLYVGVAESLDAFLQELQRQMRLIARQTLADRLDEDGVVGGDAQT